MKCFGMIVAVALLTGLSGCGSFSGSDGERVIVGRSITGGELTLAHGGASVDMGGKHFQVTKEAVTWDQGGRVQLPEQWSELELDESFGTIAIEVDGRWLADVKE